MSKKNKYNLQKQEFVYKLLGFTLMGIWGHNGFIVCLWFRGKELFTTREFKRKHK